MPWQVFEAFEMQLWCAPDADSLEAYLSQERGTQIILFNRSPWPISNWGSWKFQTKEGKPITGAEIAVKYENEGVPKLFMVIPP